MEYLPEDLPDDLLELRCGVCLQLSHEGEKRNLVAANARKNHQPDKMC
jgi:hypothetical protein